MSENRRNIAIGLTVIAGLTMLCGLIILFAGLPQLFKSGYEVRMHFWETYDIIVGDPIYLRGKRVGLVTEVAFTQGDPRKGVTIVAKVDSDVILPRNIEVRVFTKGLVGKGYLTLTPPAEPGEEVGVFSTDETIELEGIHDSGNGLLPQELTESLKNFGTLAKNLNELISPVPTPATTPTSEPASHPTTPPLPAGLKGTVARMNRTLDALYAITGDEKNQANLKTTLANFAQATAKADEAMAALKDFIKQGEKTLGGADELTRKLITSAEDISALLTSIRTTVDKINRGKGTAGKLMNDPKLYNNLTDTGEQMTELVKDFRRLVKQWEEQGVGIKMK